MTSPDNDFNDAVKRLDSFQQRVQNSGMVLTGIVPGSFYKRLFSNNFLTPVVSSNSLHWISEVEKFKHVFTSSTILCLNICNLQI